MFLFNLYIGLLCACNQLNIVPNNNCTCVLVVYVNHFFKQMEKHLREECQNVNRSCVFAIAGCTFAVSGQHFYMCLNSMCLPLYTLQQEMQQQLH